MKPLLLFVGDAGCSSGFERSTRYICKGLQKSFDVHVLAINYYGDPNYVNGKVEPWPYPMWTCHPGGDFFGVGRLKELMVRLKPACVVVQSDPWNFRVYQDSIAGRAPTIGIVAVDGKNCRGDQLEGLKLAVFWTEFGEEQARLGGYSGPSAVIPLGVDRSIYQPLVKPLVRQKMKGLGEVLTSKGLDLDTFLIGVVGRNQPRKRLDLTLDYFAEWLHEGTPVDERSKITIKKNAALWLHVAPTGEQAYDLDQMSRYLSIQDRVLLADVPQDGGVPEQMLTMLYNAFDIGFSTTQGEGFGLPCFEMMACGVPSIVPHWSAFGELIKDAGITIPCTSTIATDHGINVIGGIADKKMTVAALELLYSNRALRDEYGQRALALASQSQYNWGNIGEAFRLVTLETLEMKEEACA